MASSAAPPKKTPKQLKRKFNNEETPHSANTTMAAAEGVTASPVYDRECFTITFGDRAENHVGMQMLGDLAESGFAVSELEAAAATLRERGFACELVRIDEQAGVAMEPAAILIVRQGVGAFLQDGQTADGLYEALHGLRWDTKAKMYGRVVNKKMRHNLCFGDHDQEPDYEHGRGRVVAFDGLPELASVHTHLASVFGDKAAALKAEG
eukprot:m.116333 g.116333  ORF g.116333 m.116333 type:complete len:209 (-) comp16376_c0_seq4:82-708(-)